MEINNIINQVKVLLENNNKTVALAITLNPDQFSPESDIDFFCYCSEIFSLSEREQLYKDMNTFDEYEIEVMNNDDWGNADKLILQGKEIWLMFFLKNTIETEIDQILSGQLYIKRNNYFYPTGRLAMFQKFFILFDKTEFIKSINLKLVNYPEALFNNINKNHKKILTDWEDMERAVARKDTIFFHFALEIMIDSLLQYLFNLNKIYFPCRKKNIEQLEQATRKPHNLKEKIESVYKISNMSENLKQGYQAIRNLVAEILTL